MCASDMHDIQSIFPQSGKIQSGLLKGRKYYLPIPDPRRPFPALTTLFRLCF